MGDKADLHALQVKTQKLKPRKAWEETKKFAAARGVDTKMFGKGLGPAWDQFASVSLGAAEVHSYVPIDERTVKPMRSAFAKLDAVLKRYEPVCKGRYDGMKVWNSERFAWYALYAQLQDIRQRAEKTMKLAEAELRKNARR